MPRTVQEILDHADELADRFEKDGPTGPGTATPLGELYSAVQNRATAERTIVERVKAARAAGFTWPAIGMMLGTTAEAARQRYGKEPKPADEVVTPLRGRRATSGASAVRGTRSTGRTVGVAAKTTQGKATAKSSAASKRTAK